MAGRSLSSLFSDRSSFHLLLLTYHARLTCTEKFRCFSTIAYKGNSLFNSDFVCKLISEYLRKKINIIIMINCTLFIIHESYSFSVFDWSCTQHVIREGLHIQGRKFINCSSEP